VRVNGRHGKQLLESRGSWVAPVQKKGGGGGKRWGKRSSGTRGTSRKKIEEENEGRSDVRKQERR